MTLPFFPIKRLKSHGLLEYRLGFCPVPRVAISYWINFSKSIEFFCDFRYQVRPKLALRKLFLLIL